MSQDGGVTAVVLAAGQGKRMKSNRPKVLARVLGREMIAYVLDALATAGITKPVVVVGHGGNEVVDFVGDSCLIAWQREQMGTGHAVQCALPELGGFEGDVVVTCGDTPLIQGESYRQLVEQRRRSGCSAVLATMILDDPRAYGRVCRGADGGVVGIVEFKDATEEQRRIREVNTGTYCFEASALAEALGKLTNQNAQGEYYLTDTIAHLLAAGRQVGALVCEDPDEFLGVNDPRDLAVAEERLGHAVKQRHLAAGVVLEEPGTIRIEPKVQIGPRTRIRPGTILEGRTVVGADCVIGPSVVVRDISLPDGAVVSPQLIAGPGSG